MATVQWTSPQHWLLQWCQRLFADYPGEAAVPAMLQRTEQLCAQHRQLAQQLEAHRSRMAPLQREAEELRHQLAARRQAQQKSRQQCQCRLEQVVASLSQLGSDDKFGPQVAAVLEKLLLEQEEDMLIMDPSRTLTEQVRHRWLREYDICTAECEALRHSLEECDQKHRDMAPEEKRLRCEIDDLQQVIDQLHQMCRTLRHWEPKI